MGELEEKIKKELLKSGFPLQIFCQRCLLKNDWQVLQSAEYYVGDNGTRKEIDVIGYFSERLTDRTRIVYDLHIECKKSENNPWVFFKDERRATNIGPKIAVNYRSAYTARWRTDRRRLIEGLHFTQATTSSIYTPAFRKTSNQIHEAVSSVILSYQLREDFVGKHRELVDDSHFNRNSIRVGFLTILFDGKLYVADIEVNDNIKLAEMDSITFCQREIKFPLFRSYTIDIVSRDYFPKYLDMLNEDRKLISDFFRKEIEAKGD